MKIFLNFFRHKNFLSFLKKIPIKIFRSFLYFDFDKKKTFKISPSHPQTITPRIYTHPLFVVALLFTLLIMQQINLSSLEVFFCALRFASHSHMNNEHVNALHE
jgi:hypothetical protein